MLKVEREGEMERESMCVCVREKYEKREREKERERERGREREKRRAGERGFGLADPGQCPNQAGQSGVVRAHLSHSVPL